MESLVSQINRNFRFFSFKKILFLTWFFVGVGVLALVMFLGLAFMMPGRGFFSYFLENLGLFFLVTFLLMGYSGVYFLVTAPDISETGITRKAIRAAFAKTHYFFAISILMLLLLTVTVLLETGISSLSYIPQAGPLIMSLLTAPIFLVNLGAILFVVTVFVVSPPIVIEADSLRSVFLQYRITIKSKWVSTVIYIVSSLALLFLALVVIYVLTAWAVGVTRAVQWHINGAYSRLLEYVSIKSYLSRLVYSTVSSSGITSAMDKFGYKEFIFPEAITAIISISYLAVFSFMASFPLAVWFNVSSFFFGEVKEK